MEKIYFAVFLLMMTVAMAQATCHVPAEVTQPIKEPIGTLR